MNADTLSFGGNVEFSSSHQAIFELEKQAINCARGAGELNEAAVILEPDNIPLLEIRGMVSYVVFVCERHHPSNNREIGVPHGQPFRASIEIRPRKGESEVFTTFTHYDA